MKINVRRIVFILFFFFLSIESYGQVFTQTFVDRCTGEVKVVTANFVNGSATVAFYNKVRTFTYQEFTNGELQSWLVQTYAWWNALSPCSTATTQAQQAQQTAQNATNAATSATNAATSATQNTTTNVTNNTNTNTSNTNQTTNNTTENTTSGTGGSTEGSGTSEGGGTTETKTEETKTESEKSGGEEGGEEGGTEDESGGDDENGKESDEKEEVEKEEKKEEEKKKEKKKRELMPIQLRADMLSNQSLLGTFDIVTSISMNRSSIFGDETFGATAMVWSNLRQYSLNGSYTKVHMEKLNISTITHDGHTHYSKTNEVTVNDPTTPPIPKVSRITSASVGYMNNFGTNAVVASINELKPLGKWGTVGVGVMISNIFDGFNYEQTSIGYNVLYANSVNVSPRIQYSPALIWTQTPYVTKIEVVRDRWDKGDLTAQNQLRGTTIGGIAILSNSFTIRLTRRFSFNTGWTLIKFTDPIIPTLNSFMIGAKLPF